MADITMCNDTECSKCKQCYRAQATAGSYMQSYFAGSPRDKDTDKCDYFWKMEEKVVDKGSAVV
jgi:hypothetical protein